MPTGSRRRCATHVQVKQGSDDQGDDNGGDDNGDSGNGGPATPAMTAALGRRRRQLVGAAARLVAPVRCPVRCPDR